MPSHSSGAKRKEIDGSAMARLMAYAWPGNVRELENEISRAAVFAGDRITAVDLSTHVAAGGNAAEVVEEEYQSLRLRPRVERLEKLLIREALRRANGNQTKAAMALGLSRFGLQKKLRRYRVTLSP